MLVSLTRIIIFTMLKWLTTNARMFKAPTGRFFFFAKQYDANYLIVPFGASGNFIYVLQNTMASGKRHQIRDLAGKEKKQKHSLNNLLHFLFHKSFKICPTFGICCCIVGNWNGELFPGCSRIWIGESMGGIRVIDEGIIAFQVCHFCC